MNVIQKMKKKTLLIFLINYQSFFYTMEHKIYPNFFHLVVIIVLKNAKNGLSKTARARKYIVFFSNETDENRKMVEGLENKISEQNNVSIIKIFRASNIGS